MDTSVLVIVGGGLAVVTAVSQIGTRIIYDWLANKKNGNGKSGHMKPGNGRSDMDKAIITYPDLTRHCDAQLAVQQKVFRMMLKPIETRLDAGDVQFRDIQEKMTTNHTEVMAAISNGGGH